MKLGYLAIVLTGFILSGCNPESSTQAPSIREAESEPRTDVSSKFVLDRTPSLPSSKAFSNRFFLLQNDCEQSGGNFDADSKTCDCGPHQILTQTGSDFACRPADDQKLFLDPLSSSNLELSSLVGITSGSVPIQLLLLKPSEHFTDDQARAYLSSLLTDIIPLRSGEAGATSPVLSMVTSKESVPELFQGKRLAPGFSEGASKRLSNLVASAWDSSIHTPAQTSIQAISDLGCVDACIVTDQLESHTPEHRYTQTRYFYKGGIIQNKILVQGSDLNQQIILVLTPSGNLNSVVLIDTESESQIIHIFNSKLEALLNDRVKTKLHPQSIIEQIKSIPRVEKRDSGVAICESNIGGLVPSSLSSNFVRGPEASLLGWTKSAQNRRDAVEMVDSSTQIILHSYLSAEYFEYSSHAVNVINSFLEGAPSDLKIVPISASACIDPEEDISQVLRDHSNIRTINASFYLPAHSAACEQSPIAQKIRNSRSQILWVFGAGNEGMDLDKNDTGQCPDLLNDEPNLIKVAAGSLQSLERYSNRGPITVDLAASGQAAGGQGTSFAAPRVSRAAAELQSKFPSLSPDQIRKILLFSVDFNDRSPLPLKSGGVLNRKRAMALAHSYAGSESSSDSARVKKFYCGDSKLDCSAVKARIKYWKRTGLLE